MESSVLESLERSYVKEYVDIDIYSIVNNAVDDVFCWCDKNNKNTPITKNQLRGKTYNNIDRFSDQYGKINDDILVGIILLESVKDCFGIECHGPDGFNYFYGLNGFRDMETYVLNRASNEFHPGIFEGLAYRNRVLKTRKLLNL